MSKRGTITVYVGSVVTGSGGIVQDTRRPVEIQGEELAQRTEYSRHEENITDTRRSTETLYKTYDGRLVVHIEDWSRRQGEPTIESLRKVSEADLQPGGASRCWGVRLVLADR